VVPGARPVIQLIPKTPQSGSTIGARQPRLAQATVELADPIVTGSVTVSPYRNEVAFSKIDPWRGSVID
jgi:hypothetical protein